MRCFVGFAIVIDSREMCTAIVVAIVAFADATTVTCARACFIVADNGMLSLRKMHEL